MGNLFDDFDAFRGVHDFTVDPILNLPGGLEVFCTRGYLEGEPTMFIQGRRGNTVVVLSFSRIFEE